MQKFPKGIRKWMESVWKGGEEKKVKILHVSNVDNNGGYSTRASRISDYLTQPEFVNTSRGAWNDWGRKAGRPELAYPMKVVIPDGRTDLPVVVVISMFSLSSHLSSGSTSGLSPVTMQENTLEDCKGRVWESPLGLMISSASPRCAPAGKEKGKWYVRVFEGAFVQTRFPKWEIHTFVFLIKASHRASWGQAESGDLEAKSCSWCTGHLPSIDMKEPCTSDDIIGKFNCCGHHGMQRSSHGVERGRIGSALLQQHLLRGRHRDGCIIEELRAGERGQTCSIIHEVPQQTHTATGRLPQPRLFDSTIYT